MPYAAYPNHRVSVPDFGTTAMSATEQVHPLAPCNGSPRLERSLQRRVATQGGGTAPHAPDLGPLDLDLLGLVVNLSPISLNVDAVPGAGNLLGNLLCAVAGLLDGPSPLGNLLNNLLGILNRLLG